MCSEVKNSSLCNSCPKKDPSVKDLSKTPTECHFVLGFICALGGLHLLLPASSAGQCDRGLHSVLGPDWGLGPSHVDGPMHGSCMNMRF